MLAAIAYSGIMSFVLLKLISVVMPLRANATDEMAGLDVTQHGEEAYVHAEGSRTMLGDRAVSRSTRTNPSLAESPVTGPSEQGQLSGPARPLIEAD